MHTDDASAQTRGDNIYVVRILITVCVVFFVVICPEAFWGEFSVKDRGGEGWKMEELFPNTLASKIPNKQKSLVERPPIG